MITFTKLVLVVLPAVISGKCGSLKLSRGFSHFSTKKWFCSTSELSVACRVHGFPWPKNDKLCQLSVFLY